MFKRKPEKNLEDFFINRFGKELYQTFFKDYTQKVWGIECKKIDPEWGAQRIKGLSITKAILHAIKSIFKKEKNFRQKDVETSLIDQFMYPKYGPGQLWERVAQIIEEKGGKIVLDSQVKGINFLDNKTVEIKIQDQKNNELITDNCDYLFSTMAVKDLISAFENDVPGDVKEVAQGLIYRDFMTAGILLKQLKIKHDNALIPDNWIYIQEKEVKVGRLQIFNNWSPYMVKDSNTAWIGMEYFCNEGDELWTMPDNEFSKFAVDELSKIDIIEKKDVLDTVVIRMPKTYPAYFGTYDQFEIIRKFVDQFSNLFLIGRNGMHRYNNQDHSMLSAMVAVENIINNVKDKNNIWDVNTEQEYHETKDES